MHLRTVIFDLDDTLYTDWDTCHRAGLAEVGAYGVARLGLTTQETARAFLSGRDAAIRQLGPIGSAHNRTLFAQLALEQVGINPVPHAENLHRAYWRGVFAAMELEPAIPRLLTELRAAGVRTAVCTNMMADIQMRKLVALGLDEAFDCFVSSEEAGVDKPNPDIFRYTLRKAGGTEDETIMVGDSYAHDIAGAQSAGITALWINRKGIPLPPDAQTPDYEVCSMEQAAQVLCGLLPENS